MSFSRAIRWTCVCGNNQKVVVQNLSEKGAFGVIDDSVKEQLKCSKCELTLKESDDKIRGIKVE